MSEITWADGWYPDLSLDEYLSIPAMSASGLEEFRRSPAHFRYAADHPKTATDAMREGTALHLALLEPHLYEGRYVSLGQCVALTGKGDRCTNTGKVYRDGASYCGVRGHDPAAGEPMAPGIETMENEALGRIEGMRDAVLQHPEAAEFFRGKGRSEITGVWRDPATGVLCKIRLDREIERAAIHVDVKTTRSADEGFFARDAIRRGYHRKAAWYRRGMAALGRPAMASALIAVESQPPHGCQLFLFAENDLLNVAPLFDRLLARYAECLESGQWPGYDGGFRHLTIPPWEIDAPADNDSDDMETAA